MDKPQSHSPDSETIQGSTSHNPVNTDHHQQYEPLYKAVRSGDLDAVKEFLANRQEALTASITYRDEKPLHIATMFGHWHIVEGLVQLMSVNDLELANAHHSTALHFATYVRNIKAAKCMVEKNDKLVTIPDKNDWIPITLALDLGHKEMARYFYSVTPFELLLPGKGTHGARLLNRCYYCKMLDVALDLLKRCPRLAITPESPNGPTFFHTLANAPSAFLNQSQLPYWQRWIYKWVQVHQEPASLINEITVNIPKTNAGENEYMMNTSPGLLDHLVSKPLNLLGINKLYEAKFAHVQSLELLRAACHVLSTLNEEEIHSGIAASVLQAARRGNPEVIMEATNARFSFLFTENSEGMRIFSLAVTFRQNKVFNLIHGVILKDLIASYIDNNKNNLLHAAGLMPASSTYLSHIPGALLQMQRELQWFKEVESIMPPMKEEALNNDNMTPKEVFTKNHENLVKEGEKWTKDTAKSYTVVAALVATITFAAAFTVPGGNDQDTGYPMFLWEKLFMLFLMSDAISLFSSSTAVLMFLGLLTSRYEEDDFLKSLPRTLIIGLSTLFISLATMMMAFCAALFVMLHDKSWIVIPVTLLACIPVTLYILLQLPILVDIFKSTYMPGIFDRNVKPWP